ncbi:MAG: coenzyme F390 synthetase [Candidatus Binatia bacterium]|nr:MAG: coenzyme F390 synthetase [Candidatus Binatia bacterium]
MIWPDTEVAFERLRATLAWVVEHSPYYRKTFSSVGLHPSDITDYTAFRTKVPVLRKTDLVANQREHPPFGEFVTVPRSRFGSLHTSPGPIFLPRLPEENQGTETLREAIRSMGVQPGEVVHVTLSYHIMPGGLRLHRAFEAAGCLVINGGTGSSHLQLELARAWQPTVYAGTPSFLAHLVDTAREMKLDLRQNLPYRVGFSTAETLTPQLRQELQETLGIELFDHCGEAQIGPLAGECSRHDGMHLHAKDLFCEFLDPLTGEPASSGSLAEIIVTQLGPRALPLVRYAPGDTFRIETEPCPCGRPSPRVRFAGQVGAIRKIKGVLVHPQQLHNVLQQFREVERFRLVIDQPAGERYERVRLQIGTRASVADPEQFAERVAAAVKSAILLQMQVEFVPVADIPEEASRPPYREAICDLRPGKTVPHGGT